MNRIMLDRYIKKQENTIYLELFHKNYLIRFILKRKVFNLFKINVKFLIKDHLNYKNEKLGFYKP